MARFKIGDIVYVLKPAIEVYDERPPYHSYETSNRVGKIIARDRQKKGRFLVAIKDMNGSIWVNKKDILDGKVAQLLYEKD